jgi:hypothetical protein
MNKRLMQYVYVIKIVIAYGKKGHSSNCAATYNVELRQLSLFHGTISNVLRH